MSNRQTHRDLYDALEDDGLLEYGSIIPSEMVHRVLGLEVPAIGTKAQFDRLSLLELAAMDYVRNILLNSGKYLTATPSGYRILLPSENAAQVEQYISSADKKLNRALKLCRTTPVISDGMPDQIEARILMKQSGAPRRLPK
tara:strand:- start:252 stop:677 length:426 start_codon:yes stop_codon:yes gene_type:complete